MDASTADARWDQGRRSAWLGALLAGAAAFALMVQVPGLLSAQPPETHIHTIAGGGDRPGIDGGSALDARLARPEGVAWAEDGTGYVVDSFNHRVWAVDRHGVLRAVAGTGTPGYSGDDGPAPEARLHTPEGLALGPDGSLYIGDTVNRRVRQITPDGTIRTVAGTGERGHSGDGGPAVAARLTDPNDLAVGADGTLYIVDEQLGHLRKVTPDGIIHTVGVPADPPLNPFGVAVGPDGAVYVSDGQAHRVWRLSPDGGHTVVAGTGAAGFTGDGGPAAAARLSRPEGLAVGPDGALYIADRDNHRVRRVASDGTIGTIVASGQPGYSGDGGSAAAARLNQPSRVAVSPTGTIVITDLLNHRVRVVAAPPPPPPSTTSTSSTSTTTSTSTSTTTSSTTTSTSTTTTTLPGTTSTSSTSTTSTSSTSTTSTSLPTRSPDPPGVTSTTMPADVAGPPPAEPVTGTTTTSTTTTTSGTGPPVTPAPPPAPDPRVDDPADDPADGRVGERTDGRVDDRTDATVGDRGPTTTVPIDREVTSGDGDRAAGPGSGDGDGRAAGPGSGDVDPDVVPGDEAAGPSESGAGPGSMVSLSVSRGVLVAVAALGFLTALVVLGVALFVRYRAV